jgi:signal transduction histidine kinase
MRWMTLVPRVACPRGYGQRNSDDVGDSDDWLHRLDRAQMRLTHATGDDLPALLAEGLVYDLGCDVAEVWLHDAATGEPRRCAGMRRDGGADQPAEAPPRLDEQRALLIQAIRRREPVLSDHRDEPERPARATHAAVPLQFAGEPIGALLLGRAPALPAEKIVAAGLLARPAALAIEHARIVAEARAAQEASSRQLERLTTLTQITHRLLAAEELDTVVRIVAESASRLCDAAGAIVQLIDDDRQRLVVLAAHGEPQAFFERFHGSQLTERFYAETAAGQALAQRRPVVIGDYEGWPTTYELKSTALSLGVRAIVAAPMLVDGAPIGVLWVSDVSPRAFSADDIALIEALADQAALAIQHTRLVARSQEAGVLEERARLARDLHDSVTQSVYSLHLMTNAAHVQFERGSTALAATLERMRTIAQDALSEARALLYELRPAALEEEGLAKAIVKLAAAVQVRVDVPITCEIASEARLNSEAEHAVFRIVQEALANAAKYARATAIGVTIAERDGRLTVTVEDDGVGFDPAASVPPSADGRRGGMGLRSMRERAVAAGLALRIESTPGAGCRVTVEAPLADAARRAPL